MNEEGAVTAGETVPAEAVPGAAPAPRRGRGRAARFIAIITAILALLFGVPWWTLVADGGWPTPVIVVGTVLFVGAMAAFPYVMYLGHGRRHRDWAAVTGDTILGVIWVLFAWSLLGNVLKLALEVSGVADPNRIVALAVAAVSLVLLLWGYAEAMRVPRVKRVTVTLPRLGKGLDGLRVVLLTDTHYGPIDRAGWSARVIEKVNELDADIVCHTGDIADGTVAERRAQAAPLGDVRARLARTYVTGNHEYFGEADGWLDHMRELGWQPLHNQHVVVERDGARLVVAGVDDRTAASSGRPGHRADHAAALAGTDPDLPVLLLAHQPKQVPDAVAHGVDLQLSGHTHGGQIWPFHLLVRTDQPVLRGLTRHPAPGARSARAGRWPFRRRLPSSLRSSVQTPPATDRDRTQLYTSRGTGFWGPPFRVFAPSEITLLTLRAT